MANEIETLEDVRESADEEDLVDDVEDKTRYNAEELPWEFGDGSLKERAKEFLDFLISTPKEINVDAKEKAIEQTEDVVLDIDERRDGLIPDFQNLFETDLDALDKKGLLKFIAESMRALNKQTSIQNETLLNILKNNQIISRSVEPFSTITVSGTNSIDDADTVQPVIPESDNISVPTRALFIKSDDDNTAEIAVGDDNIDPDDGFILQRGQFIFVEMDLRETVLYMSSSEAGQTVEILGLV